MVNDIIDGMVLALKNEFGDGYEIYAESDVEQGLKEPCFFIASIESSRTRRVGQRYLSLNSFDINYFPLAKGGNAEMKSTADRLYESLEFFALFNGDIVRGTAMRDEIIDGVLHFFIDINVFLRREIDEVDMQTVEITVRTV